MHLLGIELRGTEHAVHETVASMKHRGNASLACWCLPRRHRSNVTREHTMRGVCHLDLVQLVLVLGEMIPSVSSSLSQFAKFLVDGVKLLIDWLQRIVHARARL